MKKRIIKNSAKALGLSLVIAIIFSCAYSGNIEFTPEEGSAYTYQTNYLATIIERKGLATKHYDYNYYILADYIIMKVKADDIAVDVKFKEIYFGPGEEFRKNYPEFAGEGAVFNLEQTKIAFLSLLDYEKKYRFNIQDGQIVFGEELRKVFSRFDKEYLYLYQKLALLNDKIFDFEKGLRKNLELIFLTAVMDKNPSFKDNGKNTQTLNSGEYYVNFHENYIPKKSIFSKNIIMELATGNLCSIKSNKLDLGESLPLGFSFNGDFTVKGRAIIDADTGVLLKRKQANKADGKIKFFYIFDRKQSWTVPFILKEEIEIKLIEK